MMVTKRCSATFLLKHLASTFRRLLNRHWSSFLCSDLPAKYLLCYLSKSPWTLRHRLFDIRGPPSWAKSAFIRESTSLAEPNDVFLSVLVLAY